MYGIIIGILLGFIIAVLPAILIFFSKHVSGKIKLIWILIVLIIPYLLKEVASIIVFIVQGHVMLNGFGPAIPLTWYISAWLIYFYFKKKYKLIE